LELKKVDLAAEGREGVKGVVDMVTYIKHAIKLWMTQMHHHLLHQRRRGLTSQK
jgi:hypothetical protein